MKRMLMILNCIDSGNDSAIFDIDNISEIYVNKSATGFFFRIYDKHSKQLWSNNNNTKHRNSLSSDEINIELFNRLKEARDKDKDLILKISDLFDKIIERKTKESYNQEI